MISVKELLTLPALQGTVVLAGKIGLNRSVRHVTVMEVPDIKRWLKGNEFLLTSFYSVRKSEDEQCAIIKELQDTCACIAVKTGQYVNCLTPKVLETADQFGIPLLQIPYQSNYIDILMSVMNRIMVDEGREEILHRFLSDVIYENYSDRDAMLERGRLLGMDLVGNSFAVLRLSQRQTEVNQRQLSARSQDLWQYLDARDGILHCCRVNWHNGYLLLVEGRDASALCQTLKKALKEDILRSVAGLDPLEHVFCVGRAGLGLDQLRRSYHDAVRAGQTGTQLYADRFLFFYDEIKPFCSLHDILSREDGGAFAELLAPVDNTDMLETVSMYFACNGDPDEIARRLYVHKNTVKYRLGRLEEKTGLHLNQPRESFLLYLAVLAMRFRDSQK